MIPTFRGTRTSWLDALHSWLSTFYLIHPELSERRGEGYRAKACSHAKRDSGRNEDSCVIRAAAQKSVEHCELLSRC